MTSSTTTFDAKDEIIFHAREFHRIHKASPRLKDLPMLPFSRKKVRLWFGTWNAMLLNAQLPLNRQPPRILVCTKCLKKFLRQVKEINKSMRSFCSSACSASFHTTGRRHSAKTKAKISASLKAHRLL